MPGKSNIQEVVEVRQNLHLVMRERGKIVARRDGHNIWLNLGREYLSQLIAYASFGPAVPVRDDRVRYMGLGIGGNHQLIPSLANAAPLVTAYPGTNVQTDEDADVVKLERPVRISGGATAFPYNVADTWLAQISAPADTSIANQVTFKRLFTAFDVSYDPYTVVPVSEVMLFTDAAAPNVYNNSNGVAYDTFDSLSKTNAFELEVNWTIEF